MVGEYKENGIWLAKRITYKWMFKNHDSLYVAFYKVRLRLMRFV